MLELLKKAWPRMGEDGRGWDRMGEERSVFGIFGKPCSASLSEAWKTSTKIRMFQACISPVH